MPPEEGRGRGRCRGASRAGRWPRRRTRRRGRRAGTAGGSAGAPEPVARGLDPVARELDPVVGHPDPLAAPDGEADEEADVPRRGERFGLALRERMPLWVRTRCGLERRNVIALTVVFVIAVALAAHHFWSGRTEPVRAPEV